MATANTSFRWPFPAIVRRLEESSNNAGETSVSMIAVWRRRARYRAELQRLMRIGPHMISDIGLSARQAEREIAKQFWQD